MKPGTSAVVFNMVEYGHLKRLLPIISGLTRAGLRIHVFTMPTYRAEIESAWRTVYRSVSRPPAR